MVDVGDDAGAASFGEFGGCFNFGEHRASFEITVFFEMLGVFYSQVVKFLLVFETVINIDVRDGSDGNENVGFN